MSAVFCPHSRHFPPLVISRGGVFAFHPASRAVFGDLCPQNTWMDADEVFLVRIGVNRRHLRASPDSAAAFCPTSAFSLRFSPVPPCITLAFSLVFPPFPHALCG